MYNYSDYKSNLFTEEGQVMFTKVRDRAKELLSIAGAFRDTEVTSGFTGDNWLMLACVDRLIELNEIVCVRENCWRQFRVYATPQVHNR